MASMFDHVSPSLVQRLQAASYAIPVVETLQEVADDVYNMSSSGRNEKQISKHIRRWMDENGFGYEDWLAGIEEEADWLPLIQRFDTWKLWMGFGFEKWLQECVRAIAFTGEPAPFFPFAAGFWIEDPNTDPPTLIAVMTALSDPELAAKQLKQKHALIFGQQASGTPRQGEVRGAKMLAQHRSGMSYRDIAIQNLRDKHPKIIGRPDLYRKEIACEREKVVKAIKAAQELWRKRDFDSSTAD